MRVWLSLLTATVALTLAGCGGGDEAASGGQGAASLAPKSSALYLSVNTDVDSGQVNQLEELLSRFPDRQRLIDEIQKSFTEEGVSWENDVKPALGETLDLVLLGLDGDFVVILKPADKEKLKALIAKGDDPPVSRELEGWTILAENEGAIDRFEQARGEEALDADAGFKAAMDGLPEEALVKLYVNGAAVTEAAAEAGAANTGGNKLTAFAAALGAESSGLKLDGALTAELEGDLASIEPFEPKLLDAAPADALVFLSGNGYQKVSESIQQVPDPQGFLDEFRSMIGVDLDEVARLFDREFAFWVAPGAPIPEITLLAETGDEAAAKATLDTLALKVQVLAQGARRQTEISGVQAEQVVIEGVVITYATFDGRFIVTTRPGAIGDVRTGGGLRGSPAFSKAVEDAGMPDSTFGFFYVNVQEIAELIEGFAGAAGEEIPPEFQRNIDPLGAFLLYAEGKPEDLKLSAFLAIE